jgi:hypothetical protein
METMDEKRRRTAYHEVGHVVLAYVLGESVDGVSIIEDEESYGRTACQVDEQLLIIEEDHDYIQRRLAGCYAGAKAEKILTGDEPPLCGNDLTAAGHLVIRLSATEEGQLAISGQAADKAETILREHWPKVRVLAEALLCQHELDREQVLAALQL